MKLYKVIAKRGPTETPCLGFPTRAAAASFARGLAESGKCDGASIEPYDDGEPGVQPEALEALGRALSTCVSAEVKKEIMLAFGRECGRLE